MPALLSRKSIFSAPRREDTSLPKDVMESWDPVSHSRRCILFEDVLRDSMEVRSRDRDRVVAMTMFEESLDN